VFEREKCAHQGSGMKKFRVVSVGEERAKDSGPREETVAAVREQVRDAGHTGWFLLPFDVRIPLQVKGQ
jgi:hypothetical protein